MEYFVHALKNYAVFSGRARRKEYWMFVLFQVLFAFAAMLLDNMLGTSTNGVSGGYIYMLYSLALMIPSLAVAVRRLHDVGKSGWFMFIVLVPLVGVVWLLVLNCTEGTPDDNEYGPNPKAEALAY